MFHVEQNETHIEVVDHFLTNEAFKIKKTWLPGLLQTHPTPAKNKIQQYYSADKYISHNSTGSGFFFFVYRFIRNKGVKTRHLCLTNLYKFCSPVFLCFCFSTSRVCYAEKKKSVRRNQKNKHKT